MSPQVIDRVTGKAFTEKVFGEKWLKTLYGGNFLGAFLLHTLVKFSWFSKLFGFWQSLPFTKKKIVPFVKEYDIDANEFEKEIRDFSSFNDFFTRHLKKSARPIVEEKSAACIPADGRYLFYENIEKTDGFVVKGKKFSLIELLGNEELAKRYASGSLVIARLAPCDYHRFHFPSPGIPGKPLLIQGPLFSVNPMALKKKLSILTENKRVITELITPSFGKVMIIEVGATNVGSIVQTHQSGREVKKGEEKGYFAFGGSTIILLFEKGKISFCKDLLQKNKEIRCLMGQAMGYSL